MIGQVIAERYRIDAEIGSGGMGTVYKGFDTSTHDIVAIKHLKSELATPDLLERFKREGESLRDLNHPNIVKMFASITENEQHFLVIEYLSGGDLRQLLQQGDTLQIETILKYAIDIADALTRAHHLNIIHRDLKPANVLIAADGTPRLADFGIAHFEARERVTETNAIIGTMDYLAPESLSAHIVDTRSDIWSFGIMLFEMLTEKHPFEGSTIPQIVLSVLTKPLPDLEELRPGIPVALADLIYRMLEKDPLQRISSVRYIGAELESILRGNDATPVTPHRFVPPIEIKIAPTLHNLPMNLSNFVGRENEIAELSRLLQENKIRLVTILAQGGMGKSRLAYEVALKNIETFADGVYLVELAHLDDPQSIVQAIIDAINCPFVPDTNQSRLQQLTSYLNDKHMLLVLDNYEHLIAGAGIVTDILNSTSKLRILVTSRQHLRQSSEHIIELTAMPYSDWNTPEDAMDYDAFQLFVQSARRIKPDFELTSDNLGYVTRICQNVQGLPLGIVLAASWLNMLSPEEIVAEMSKDFDFLESDLEDLPERQRSMRHVFDYSWQLLTEKERDILIALSVFRGGFTREAASEVCQAGLRDLMGLINKSLIQRDSESGRYSVHGLLRQYASEKLLKSLQEAAICQGHKKYFAKWMRDREREITYKRQQAALNDIEIDFENVRIAWENAVQDEDYESLNLMVEALHLFTEMRIRHDDGYKLMEQALKIAPQSETIHYRLLTRQARLGHLGGIGEFENRHRALHLAQKLAEANGDTDEYAIGLYIEAVVLHGRQSASGLLHRAFDLISENHFLRSHIMVWLSIALTDKADSAQVLQLEQSALELQRKLGDINELTWTLASLIGRLIEAAQYGEASKYIDEALQYSRMIRHPHAESKIVRNLSTIAMAAGDFEKAIDISEQAYQLAIDGNSIINQLLAIANKAEAQILLNISSKATVSQLNELVMQAQKTHRHTSNFINNSVTGMLIHLSAGEDISVRRQWHNYNFHLNHSEWIQIIVIEIIIHYRLSEDDFAPVIIGHLSKYGDDTVGWLNRWQLYQNAVSDLRSRVDKAAYQQAYQHGQSLNLDEMLETLKEKTGHPDYQ